MKNQLSRKLIRIYLFFTSVFIFSNCVAQRDDLGSWNVININYNYSEKLNLFAEGQLRSLGLYSNFHYYEYKYGVDYKVYDNVKLTFGLGSYQTYKEGGNFLLPKNNDEIRLWPQISISQYINRFKIEQRYRSELRFSNQYRNRFRYRVGIMYPFGDKKNGYHPYQIGFSNELFFTNREPYFERNRMSLNFSSKITNSTTLLVGYVKQFDYKINDETGYDFLQIGINIEFLRKQAGNILNEIELIEN